MTDKIAAAEQKWLDMEDDYIQTAGKLAAAEATIERLKCCGNCIHGSLDDFSFMCCRENDDSVPADWWGDVHVADHCHFTPSRWQRRTP